MVKWKNYQLDKYIIKQGDEIIVFVGGWGVRMKLEFQNGWFVKRKD